MSHSIKKHVESLKETSTSDIVKVENIFVACDEILVKNEVVEEDLFDQLESKLKVKCGEVFALFGGNFILVCTFCKANFSDMVLLGAHLRDQHAQEFIKKDDDDVDMSVGVFFATAVDPVGSPALRDTNPDEGFDSQRLACHTCGVTYKNRRNLVRHQEKTGCRQDDSYDEVTDFEKFPALKPEILLGRSLHRIYCDTCGISYKNQRNLVRHQRQTGCRQKKRSRNKRNGKRVVHKASSGGDVEAAVKEESETSNHLNLSFSSESEQQTNEILVTSIESTKTTKGESAPGDPIRQDVGSDGGLKSYTHAGCSGESDSDSFFSPISDSQYSCNICGRDCKNQETLDNHMQNHQNNALSDSTNFELYCFPCDRRFDSKKALSNHRRRHKSTVYTKTAISEQHAENEANIPKNPDLHCDICDCYFKNKDSLYSHSDSHDTIPTVLQSDPEFLKCKYCYEEFTKYADRKTHEGKHTGSRPYECPYCHKGFISNVSRKSHFRIHTGESPYQCDRCFKVFRDKYDLRRHIERHLNIRNVACELCEKKFYRKHQLELHMRTHTKERPYVCEDCGKTFKVLPQLKDHQLRHTGIKNVKCDVCDRLFYSRSVLKVHMASHSDEKPFECNVCGKRFSRAKAMQKHMKLHSGVKRYVCNICGKAYAQDSGLYAHKKTHARQM